VTTDADDLKLFRCPALITIKAISGKWKTRILWLLREQSCHFGELRRLLPGISAKVLSEQLKQLEVDGLITARDEARLGIIYSIYDYSDYGRSLIPVLDGLGEWGFVHEKRRAAKIVKSTDA
jgi:DNA-binding HxlR family transcriptional regulator